MQGLQSAGLLWSATKASRSQERRERHTEEARRAEEEVYQSKAGLGNDRVKARRRTGGLQRVRVRYDVVRGAGAGRQLVG